jgi:hypothetical protein
MNPYAKSDNGVDVGIVSWFDQCPNSGMVPLHISIQNPTKSEGRWNFSTTHQAGGVNTGGVFSAQLAPESSGDWQFIAPVGTSANDYGRLSLMTSGHGVSGPSPQLSAKYSSDASKTTPFIGMSAALGGYVWQALETRVNGNGASSGSPNDFLRGSRLDMARAPTDWRGYTALNQLWMQDSDWTALSAQQKRATLEWVATGGKMCLVTQDARYERKEELQLPGRVQDRKIDFGAGNVRLIERGTEAGKLADTVRDQLSQGKSTDHARKLDDYGGWAMMKDLGEFNRMSGLILGFILLFGILVGPANLIWCSKQARRHLLFITTPLLSLAGTIFLVTLMLFQDGTGGNGSRFIAAFIEPSANLMTVLQEQTSRTGVLLGRSFAADEHVWMQNAASSIKPDSLMSYGMNDGLEGSYEEAGLNRSGDWFRSRSVQNHFLAAVRPTRGGIEFTRDAADPSRVMAVSSLPLVMGALFIVEPDGRVWKGVDVSTGTKVKLQEASLNDLNSAFYKGAVKDAGPILSGLLQQKNGDRGLFFAMSEDGGKLAIETLDSIRWKRQPAVIIGPYTEVKP